MNSLGKMKFIIWMKGDRQRRAERGGRSRPRHWQCSSDCHEVLLTLTLTSCRAFPRGLTHTVIGNPVIRGKRFAISKRSLASAACCGDVGARLSVILRPAWTYFPEPRRVSHRSSGEARFGPQGCKPSFFRSQRSLIKQPYDHVTLPKPPGYPTQPQLMLNHSTRTGRIGVASAVCAPLPWCPPWNALNRGGGAHNRTSRIADPRRAVERDRGVLRQRFALQGRRFRSGGPR
jgi:hypothetical protein